jgi:site-specific DNA-methyltransferase (adenine-specific)/site-specific DNA-methyltransferase (cytosine-N4-specific)
VQANVRSVLADDGSWFVNIKEHCEDGSRHLYVKDLMIAHVRRWGWRFVDELCWTHQGMPGTWPDRFKNGWEPVFHFAASRVKHRPMAVSRDSEYTFQYSPSTSTTKNGSGQLGNPSSKDRGLARPSNVIHVPRFGMDEGGKAHPGTFPVALPSFFLRAYSDAGDVVLDPFAGSGTTLIAAQQLGRRGLGVEISPAYCDVIVARWEAFTGQKAELQRGT